MYKITNNGKIKIKNDGMLKLRSLDPLFENMYADAVLSTDGDTLEETVVSDLEILGYEVYDTTKKSGSVIIQYRIKNMTSEIQNKLLTEPTSIFTSVIHQQFGAFIVQLAN